MNPYRDYSQLQIFDFSVNIYESKFKGIYDKGGDPVHPEDIERVLYRAKKFGVDKCLFTA